VFVSEKPFHPSLSCVGKARSLPKSGAPERLFIRVGSGLTHKHKTRLKKLDTDKHSSLLYKFVSFGLKSFITFPFVSSSTSTLQASKAYKLGNSDKRSSLPHHGVTYKCKMFYVTSLGTNKSARYRMREPNINNLVLSVKNLFISEFVILSVVS
jgi:hypothetical protein